jgi:uncharacterized damage-inducible protein DinB
LDGVWIEAFKYHRWANLYLLDVCAKLTDEQLQLTAPGTYGTIAATWLHLVGGEHGYLARLDGGKRAIKGDDEFPGLARLRELAADSADRLIEAARKIKPDDVIETKYEEGFKLHMSVVIIQALHHGNDHRTHVCTILGAHDIPYGEMDVWAYGEATGLIVPVEAKG